MTSYLPIKEILKTAVKQTKKKYENINLLLGKVGRYVRNIYLDSYS